LADVSFQAERDGCFRRPRSFALGRDLPIAPMSAFSVEFMAAFGNT
jgi:hypothetical protein